MGLSQKNRTSENTVRFIDAQLDQLVDSLDNAGKNFTEFRSKKGIVNLSTEAELVVEKLEGARKTKEQRFSKELTITGVYKVIWEVQSKLT